MPVITCPSCRAKYDPGVDEDPGDLPGSISLKVVCPACGQWVRLPEREPIDPPDVPKDLLKKMAAQSRLVGRGDDRPARRPAEDDDRPRRRRERDEDEDDDRPRRRNHGDTIEDDYRDGPRPRRAGGDGLGTAAMITGIASISITLLTGIMSCLCAFFVLGVGVGAIGGIVAIVLGFMARSRTPGSGPGLTGILTGFGSLAGALLFVILLAVGIGVIAMNQPPGGAGGGGPVMQRNRF